MYDTHTPSEWAQIVSLAVSAYAALSVPYFLLVDAELADFDPRPAVRRTVESGRLDPLWQAAVDAGHALNWVIGTSHLACRRAAKHARHTARDAAIGTVFHLLLLAAPKGAVR